MLVASEEATAGSVIAKQERSRPRAEAPASATFWSGVPNSDEDFHVADIGRVAIEDFRRGQRAAKNLAEMAVFVVGEAGAFGAVGIEQVPQALAPGLALQRLHSGARSPAFGAVVRLV